MYEVTNPVLGYSVFLKTNKHIVDIENFSSGSPCWHVNKLKLSPFMNSQHCFSDRQGVEWKDEIRKGKKILKARDNDVKSGQNINVIVLLVVNNFVLCESVWPCRILVSRKIILFSSLSFK